MDDEDWALRRAAALAERFAKAEPTEPGRAEALLQVARNLRSKTKALCQARVTTGPGIGRQCVLDRDHRCLHEFQMPLEEMRDAVNSRFGDDSDEEPEDPRDIDALMRRIQQLEHGQATHSKHLEHLDMHTDALMQRCKKLEETAPPRCPECFESIGYLQCQRASGHDGQHECRDFDVVAVWK